MNEVGIPQGVYNVVHGFGPETGEFLTTHPGVDGITFTGETATGSIILKAAPDICRPPRWRLGGKNAAIVFADCDLDKAIEGTVRSVFANCGQVCLGTERVYVDGRYSTRSSSGWWLRRERAEVGYPDDEATTMGPLISQEHRHKVLSYYKHAEEEGAEVLHGGGAPKFGDELSRRLLGRADDLDGPRRRQPPWHRGDFRTCRATIALRPTRKRRSGSPTTPLMVWRPDLDRELLAGASRRRRRSRSASPG